MMRDEAVAATDVKHARFGGKYTRDFQGHVVSTADLATASFTSPPALDTIQPQVSSRIERTPLTLGDGFSGVVG
jgi:hypothetical protein